MSVVRCEWWWRAAAFEEMPGARPTLEPGRRLARDRRSSFSCFLVAPDGRTTGRRAMPVRKPAARAPLIWRHWEGRRLVPFSFGRRGRVCVRVVAGHGNHNMTMVEKSWDIENSVGEIMEMSGCIGRAVTENQGKCKIFSPNDCVSSASRAARNSPLAEVKVMGKHKFGRGKVRDLGNRTRVTTLVRHCVCTAWVGLESWQVLFFATYRLL